MTALRRLLTSVAILAAGFLPHFSPSAQAAEIPVTYTAAAGANSPAPVDTTNPKLALNWVICISGIYPTRDGGVGAGSGDEPYLGEIRCVTFDALTDFLPCDGRLLLISQNAALFSLLGTSFGGNGSTTFALPDLRGRVPVGVSPGNAQYELGAAGGQEAVSLNSSQLPSHSHSITVAPNSTGSTGANQAFSNQQPYLALNICIQGGGVFQSIGWIRVFPYTFTPTGFYPCTGGLVATSSNPTLFAQIATTFGGWNGNDTLGLPDLRGRALLGIGAGAGLTSRQLGELSGASSLTLTASQLPAHSHALAVGTTGSTGSATALNKSQPYLALKAMIATQGIYGRSESDPAIGEVRFFAQSSTANGYVNCDGALMPINQNAALFSLLGTTFGGNGIQNFALPDLQGRSAVSTGQGVGLTNCVIGEKWGTETVTLTTAQMPVHTHTAPAPNAPTNVVANAGNRQVSLTFNPPSSNGGSAITSYIATSNPGGLTGTSVGAATAITVTGLTNGTAYTFTVAASNAIGTSLTTGTSNSVIIPYVLTYTAGANGTLSGYTTQLVVSSASGTAVSAVPANGYHFQNWSDGSTANPRTDANVMANVNVTAFFGLNALAVPVPPVTLNGPETTVPTVILNGPETIFMTVNSSYSELGAFSGPSALVAGGYHSLALRSDGKVVAWGSKWYGQTTIPAGLNNVVAIAAGSDHSLALCSDGTVVAWGSNFDGQTTIPAGLSNVVAIAAGGSQSLALRSNGTVVAWGAGLINDGGANPPYHNWGQSIIPDGLNNVVAIAAGSDHSLALCSDGKVVAWGRNRYGQTTIPAGLNNVVAIAAGIDHSLALCSDGKVVAWGDNASGQTTLPAGLSNVVAIAAGYFHSLALRSDRTVVAWGYNAFGQTTIPPGLNNVVAIAAGGYQSQALRSDGKVVAWGDNDYGQMTIPASVYLPATISGSVDTHTPGSYLLSYTAANCLGATSTTTRTVVVLARLNYKAGANGTLSGATPQFLSSSTATGSAVTAVPATGYHFLNWSDGSTANPRTDTNVMTNVNVTASFAINTYTPTYTAGSNGSLIGTTPQTVNYNASSTAIMAVPATGYHFVNWSDGSTANPRTDTNVTADLSVTANFAIDTFSLTYTAGAHGLLTGTTPQTVDYGTAGTAVTAVPAPGYHFASWSDGSTANPRTDTNVTSHVNVTAFFGLNAPTVPVPTVTLNGSEAVFTKLNTTYTELGAFSGPSALAAGMTHSLALRSDGTVSTWGDDSWGQMTIPLGLSNVVAIAGGGNHSLVLRRDGTVAAWGDNDYGQTTIPPGLNNVVAIAGGMFHNLALRSDGTVVGWGAVFYGQTIPSLVVPPGLSNVVAIGAGGNHSLALRSDGTVAAWGFNDFGQTTIPAGLSNVVAIAVGGYHNLALCRDGTVVAWGYNEFGQTTIPPGLNNVVAIAAGGLQSLALRSDGTVVAWGAGLINDGGANPPYNNWGQSIIPDGLGNVVAIAAGYYHSLALCRDGTVVGWGYNLDGRTTTPAAVYLPATVSGSVDSHTLGSYVLTYTAANFLGITGSTTRMVVVPPEPTSTLTYTAGLHGTLTGTTPQTINYGASGTAVTAVPATGYRFVSWSDGSTANPRTDTNVMASRIVTANFEINTVNTWRETYFGPAATNTGTAADAADPYHTGVPNLLVYAFFGPAQDPATVRSSQLPQATASGGSLSYEFTEPSGVSGLTYGAEWSATLGNDWQPVTDTGIAPVHNFRVPLDGSKKFLRLRVTTQ